MSSFLPTARETAISDGLSRAIRDDTLDLHMQPILCLATDTTSGWEALLRHTNARLGPVAPVEFIPIAERTGVIVEIGMFVIDAACAWRAKLDHEQGVAVNISARQLRDRRFATRVLDILDRHELTAQSLCLELTETVAIDNVARATATLQRLREHGVNIALDDFGAGFASLDVLRRLPVNIVKIDRSYVAKVGSGGREDDFLGGMIGLSERMGARVVVEGIERESQLEAVRALGAHWAQGYLLGRPRSAATVLRRMRAERIRLTA